MVMLLRIQFLSTLQPDEQTVIIGKAVCTVSLHWILGQHGRRSNIFHLRMKEVAETPFFGNVYLVQKRCIYSYLCFFEMEEIMLIQDAVM